MTTEQCFSLLRKIKRNERVYIWTKSDEDVMPINWHKSYSRNELFVNSFGDIITTNGIYVGNLKDSNISIL